MKNKMNTIILLMLFGSLTLIPFQNLLAQTGIECLGCGGMNGNHKPGCKYMVSSGTSNTSTKSSSFENEIMGVIFSNMFNSFFNSSNSKEDEAEKIQQQQDEQIRQQRLAALIVLQKKYNDSIAQARHNKMMKEYKKLDDGSDLKYKSLDDNQWKPSITFNCKITSFKGDVKVYKSIDGKLYEKKLSTDQPIDLAPGDWISTGPKSSIKLHYGIEKGGKDIILGQKSAINIVTDENGTHIPKCVRGNYYVTNNLVSEKAVELREALIAKVDRQSALLKKKFNPIRLPGGTASIRGTEFSIEVDSVGNSIINIFQGIVEITDNNQIYKLTLTAGQKGIVTHIGNLSGPISIKEEEIIRWWKEE